MLRHHLRVYLDGGRVQSDTIPMKIQTKSQAGHILLVLIAGVAVVGIVYIGYHVIKKLDTLTTTTQNPQYTNLVEWANERYVPPAVTVTIPEWGVTNLVLPTEAVNQPWFYKIQTSTNLQTWEDTDLEWDQALELSRTNHIESQRFYRRVLCW